MSDLFDGLNEAVLAAFGESVIYRRIGQADITVTAVLRDEVAETESPGWLASAFLEAGAVDSPARGNQIFRGTDAYTVIDYSRDAAAGLTLKLRRV